MITLKARYDGRAFIPQEPVDLPAGCELEVLFTPPPARKPLAELAEIFKQFPENPDAPTDFAMQHDHYLYGTPKKENP